MPANTPPQIAALPTELQSSASDLLSMVLNGECSFAFVIGWADRALDGAQRDNFVEYVRGF